MKIVHKFILRNFLGPFVFTFFISVFILLMQFLWKYLDDLVGKGLEWYTILELLYYASFTFVPMALPLAVLLSSIMVFGNLGERYELVALKAAGISLRKIMLPLIVFSIFVSAGAFFFSNNFLPFANLKFRTILYDIKKQKTVFNVTENVFNNDVDNFTIRVKKKEDDGKILRGILIYDHSKQAGNYSVTTAEWGTMEIVKKNLVFTLYNGHNYDDYSIGRQKQKNPARKTNFEQQIVRIDLSGFDFQKTNENLFKKHYQMMSLKQLTVEVDTIRKEITKRLDNFYDRTVSGNYPYLKTILNKEITLSDTITYKESYLDNFSEAEKRVVFRHGITKASQIKKNFSFKNSEIRSRRSNLVRYEVERHRKFTLSIACLILFFIGAPLGAIIRKGGLGLPMVISILLFILYYIVLISGEKSAKALAVKPYEGMWLASVVFLPVGIFLTYKATKDAPLLDIESWNKSFRKIQKFIPFIKKFNKKT